MVSTVPTQLRGRPFQHKLFAVNGRNAHVTNDSWVYANLATGSLEQADEKLVGSGILELPFLGLA